MPAANRHDDEYAGRVVALSTLSVALVLTVLVAMTLTLVVDRTLLGSSAGPPGPPGPPGPAATDATIPTEPIFDALEAEPQRLADILSDDLDERDQRLAKRISDLRAELVALCDTLSATSALQADAIQCP